MRTLTPGQKMLLKKFPDVYCYEDMGEDAIKKLVALSDHETVYMDADRFLSDQYARRV